ncbi:hypothetical protein HB364_10415 [Pseudoflavitalea sp. X16]|uniref:hypothetical protein n=1 Tax=Paraflavitalea devenefica TaxID=2716334 RepID=UPI001423C87B|nr:hypothetical protein [Paraflavitalea devenefica]NII25497.1 hypothetical protein [Paraflavitalea devenefica]
MKRVILLLIVCLVAHMGYGQAPFTGGGGSGYTGNATGAISCTPYAGGVASGATTNKTPATACTLYSGGVAGGAAVNKTPATTCTMYAGGNGGGYNAAHSSCGDTLLTNTRPGTIHRIYFVYTGRQSERLRLVIVNK